MPHQRERNGVQANVRLHSQAFNEEGKPLESFRFAVRVSYDGTDYQGKTKTASPPHKAPFLPWYLWNLLT